MKISKLIPSSIFASKAKDEKVTLFLNKTTGTVCYKDENNEVKEVGNGVSDVTTLQTEVGAIPSAPLYLEVDITDTQIKNINPFTPVELLPAIGGSFYYEFKMLLEYTGGTTGYTIGTNEALALGQFDGGLTNNVTETALSYLATNDIVDGVISVDDTVFNEGSLGKIIPGQNIALTTSGGSTPTLGDGTIKAKIWYTIRAFG